MRTELTFKQEWVELPLGQTSAVLLPLYLSFAALLPLEPTTAVSSSLFGVDLPDQDKSGGWLRLEMELPAGRQKQQKPLG